MKKRLEDWDRALAGKRWYRFARCMVRGYLDHQVGRSAAALAYYFLFSFFPFLIFLSALVGFLGPEALGLEGAAELRRIIPAQVLDRRRLGWVNPGAFLLDLASAPGGVDQAAVKERGLRVLQAPGLPGRTAPVTAAAAIRDAVYHILWELEG